MLSILIDHYTRLISMLYIYCCYIFIVITSIYIYISVVTMLYLYSDATAIVSYLFRTQLICASFEVGFGFHLEHSQRVFGFSSRYRNASKYLCIYTLNLSAFKAEQRLIAGFLYMYIQIYLFKFQRIRRTSIQLISSFEPSFRITLHK